MAGALDAVRGWWRREEASGPRVARLFDRLLALVFLDAWLSLGSQVVALVGERGLLPLAEFVPAARAEGLTFARWPSLFLYAHSDGMIRAGVWAGVALAALALVGVLPRLCLALSGALYLSYAVGCRTFCGFQWDSMILECALLAAVLPRDRPARWAHALFRVLLFKLYFESGIAKWQSHLHDWQDGSAMAYYFETAPLPAWPAWYAHHEPLAWHHFESRATLVVELLVPFLAFGPRRARLTAFAVLTAFQVINLLTANYGFFVYLSLALHVFLLDDADVARAGARLRAGAEKLACAMGLAAPGLPSWWPRWKRAQGRRAWRERLPRGVRAALAAAFCAAYAAVSAVDGLVAFLPEGSARAEGFFAAVEPLRQRYEPFRLVNTYHLFGHITRERYEADFQTYDGVRWASRGLWYKPGDPARAPGWVAPHQPRLDFQLWFYALSFRRGMPAYVAALVERMCADPAAVQGFFRDELPARPVAVRVAFWRYHFTTAAERRATGDWWARAWVGATAPLRCADVAQTQ